MGLFAQESTLIVHEYGEIHEYEEGLLRKRMIEIEGEGKGDQFIAFKLIHEEGDFRPSKIVSMLNFPNSKLHYREKLGQSAREE